MECSEDSSLRSFGRGGCEEDPRGACRLRVMGLTNVLLTAACLAGAALMLGGDVRRATTTLRRNVRVMRGWMNEMEEAGKEAGVAEEARKAIGDGEKGKNAASIARKEMEKMAEGKGDEQLTKDK